MNNRTSAVANLLQCHNCIGRGGLASILEIIEPPKVKVADGQIPPEDPLVATYRRRLSSVVLS